MDLAGFSKSSGIESDAFTTSATFFEDYNWRDIRCSSCKRHIGYVSQYVLHRAIIHLIS